MKIERLRNKKSKLIFLCGFLVVVVLLITVVIKGSKAKYRNSNIIPLINTKVKNNISDFTVMGIYLNDGGPITGKDGKKYTKQADTYTMPSSGYVINEANSYCTLFNKDTNTSEEVTKTNNPDLQLYTDILGNHSIKGIKKGYKCYLFFDEGINKFMSAKNFLLGMWGYEDVSTITERTDFNAIRTDGGNKLHKAQDDYGTSYYLVGNPQNNWVKFGGYFWRIVRINGNGSLRLLYQGTPDESRVGGNMMYWSYYNYCSEYGYCVGYMFDTNTIGTTYSSNVKQTVDNFYKTKLSSVDIDKYIDKNVGFCNDRSYISGNPIWTGGAVFSAKNRLVDNKTPILTCPEKERDLFTLKTANNGNKALDYPIGLITGDELAMSGLVYNQTLSDVSSVFTLGSFYWTMTPIMVGSFGEQMSSILFAVGKNDAMSYGHATGSTFGIRPVVNLIKDIKFSKGNGTSSSPFEI